MQIVVIEFELTCVEHGAHRTVVPAELPRPRHCAHCFRPIESRRELRRFSDPYGIAANPIGSELFIG